MFNIVNYWEVWCWPYLDEFAIIIKFRLYVKIWFSYIGWFFLPHPKYNFLQSKAEEVLEFLVTVYKIPPSLRKFCGGLRPHILVQLLGSYTSPSLVRFPLVPCCMTCPHRVFLVKRGPELDLVQLSSWVGGASCTQREILPFGRTKSSPRGTPRFSLKWMCMSKSCCALYWYHEGRKRSCENRDAQSCFQWRET